MTPAIEAIAAAIGESTGVPFAASSVKPVGGGSIHQAWHINDGVRHFFVKTGATAVAPMLAAETCGLQALSASAVVRTPTLIAQGQTSGGAFLVL